MSGAEADTRRVVRGTLANYLAEILQLCLFIFHALGARLFGKAGYGAYIFAWGVVEIANKIGVAGLDKGVMRAVATARAAGDREAERTVLAMALRTVLVVGTAVVLAISLLAGPLAAWRGGEAASVFAPVLQVLVFLVVPWSLVVVLVYASMARGTMRYNLLVRGVSEPLLLIGMLAAFGLIWRDGGGRAMAGAHLAAECVVLAAAVVLTARILPLRSLLGPGLLRRPADWNLIRFSTPVALAELLNQAIYRTDVILLSLLLGDPLQAANYGACILLAGVVSSIRYAYDPLLCPVVAEVTVSRDIERLGRNLQTMVRWVSALALPVWVSLVVFGGQLLTAWGDSYREAALTLAILATAHLVNSTMGLHQWPVVMSGRSRLDLANNAAAFAVCLAANLLLIPHFGLPGAAAATLLGNLTLRGLQAVQVWRIFGVYAYSRHWLKLALGAGAALAVEMLVRTVWPRPDWWGAGVGIAAGLATYGAVVLAAGLAPEDRELLAGAIARIARRREG